MEILPGALRLAAELSARYIYDRFLPDKAIDLVDRAAAKEVIRLTNVTEGSVISALVNASLNNIGSLRIEAFRRGDIASEYIFQEIENAYRNFLLRWIESPLIIPEEPLEFLSPISQGLFDKMRISILKRVDELLFSSNKPRAMIQKVQVIQDLSQAKNLEVYKELSFTINQGYRAPITIYRVGLFIYAEWLEAERCHLLVPKIKGFYFNHLKKVIYKAGMLEHVNKIRKKLKKNVTKM